MKQPILIISTLIFLSACGTSEIDFANEWSKDVKKRIIQDCHIPYDIVNIDSSKNDFWQITLLKNDIKLISYRYRPSTKDTVVSIFYSKGQDFELIRELCPAVDRSFEGIRYLGKHIGLTEFRYCDGTLKESGFRFKGNVGKWTKYDTSGDIIETEDLGNTERLAGLINIKYK